VTTPDFTNTGGGISFEVPVTLPSALGEVSSAIASGVAEAGAPDPISVRRRWAIITAINPEDSTVDINLGGVTIPHVSYDATYHPAIDEVVQVNVVDTDITVIGPTANALYVGYIRREGTIVKVNTAAGAPGAPTSVNVTLDDAQDPVTILNVPYVSPYFPTVNDSVMLGQGTNTNVYLVLGAVNRTFRRPTGDIEMSVLGVAKPNTLLCQGQTVSRATYAALWAWVQLNGLVGANLPFGAGDGSTSFTLPDFRGRVPIGVGTLGSDTYNLGNTGGAARFTLAESQMPSHGHGVGVTINAGGDHDHALTIASVANHSHTFTTASAGGHAHTFTTNPAGAHFHNIGGDGDHFHNFSGTSGGGGGHAHTLAAARAIPGAHAHWGAPGTSSEGMNDAGWVAAGAIGTGGEPNHTHGYSGSTSIHPAHSHGGRVSDHVDHTHTGPTTTDGAHTHTGPTTADGGHTHTGTAATEAAHTHTTNVSQSNAGGTTAVDNRQPYLAVQFLIWT
jgi:microcystin-dependent protein